MEISADALTARIARLVVGAALVALAAGGLTAASAGAAAPAGTITARIGVGTEGAPVQFAGGQVWVLARNGLIRVSPRTNRVVGRPLRLPGQPAGPPTGPSCQEAPSGLSAGAGRLWAFGGSRVYRIDPRRGIVTGTIRLGRKGSVCVRDVAAGGGSVYVLDAAADRPGQTAPPAARLVRFNARTLAAGFRFPRAALKNAATVQVHPTGVILSSFGFDQAPELTRLGRRGTKDRSVVVEIPAPALTRGGAWVPGNANLARVDLATFAYDGHVVRTTGRQPMAHTLGLGALWVAASQVLPRPGSTGSSPRPPIIRDSVLYRADPVTGVVAGDPIRLPQPAARMATGAGSLWVVTQAGKLLRIRPARPLPPPAVVPPPTLPPPLLGGPLGPGTYRTQAPYEVPLDITLAEGGWLSTSVSGSSGPLDDQVVAFQRTDSPTEAFNIALVAGVFGAGGKQVLTSSPADAIAAWQANPGLVVTVVGPTTVGGRPATVVEPPREEARG